MTRCTPETTGSARPPLHVPLRRRRNNAPLLATAMLLAGLVMGAAQGAIVITVEQQGSDVVIDYSGSWDNWTRTGVSQASDFAVYGLGLYNLEPGDKDQLTQGLTLDSGLWTSTLTRPNSTSGDYFAWKNDFTYAPLDYTAGSPIAGSMTFNNTDLLTMGFTPGDSGSWTGTAGTANFSVVPEPTSAALLLVGVVGGVAFAGRRRGRLLAR